MLRKRRQKRIIAIIAAFTMCISLIVPVGAFTPPVEGDRDYSPSTVGMFDQGYWNLLLAPGADETQMNFSWHSERSVTDVSIGIQERGEPTTYRFFPGTTRDNVLVTSIGNTDFHSQREYQVNNVTVTGLKPDTTYDYVLIQDTAPSEFFSFKTANPNRFSFYAMSDIQIGADSNNIAYGQVRTGGSAGHYRNQEFHTENWKAALSIARRTAPHGAFIMSAGDQVEAVGSAGATFGVYQGEYDLFASPKQLSGLPIVSSVGNHDFHPMFLDHYNVPQNTENFFAFGQNSNASNYTTADNGVAFDYWFRHGNTFFLVLGSSTATGTYPGTVTVSATRRATIESWAAANSDATWKIAMFHFPPYSIYRADTSGEKAAMRNAFTDILDGIGIDLVINGHCHSYNRTHHIRGITAGATANASTGNVIKAQYWVDATDGTVHFGEYGDDNSNNGAGGPNTPGWNDLGTEGYDIVLNPEGIVYITISTPTGSKFYETNRLTGSGSGNPRYHSAKFQHQTELPHFSVIDVTENTLTFTTYQIEGKAGSSLATLDGVAPLPGGTAAGTTTPANGTQITASNDVSVVDSYTIIKTSTPSENVTPTQILAYLAQEVEVTNIHAIDIENEEIEVKAQIIDDNAVVIPAPDYNVEINWGAMEFTYSFEPTHGTGLGWQTTDIDGANNRVEIINRSTDGAIDTAVLYRMDAADVFNTAADINSNTAVRGGFYESNADALAAAAAATNTGVLPASVITLESSTTSTPSADVYFAFTGEPERDGRLTINMTKVGTITVSVRPAGYYYSSDGERFHPLQP